MKNLLQKPMQERKERCIPKMKRKLLGNSILTLLVVSVLLVTGCASQIIPNIKLHAEIPFVDGSEGAYIETVTKISGLINAKDWEKLRPYMLMIHINDWAKIKKSWLKACRFDRKRCNVAVDSIEDVVRRLDSMANKVMGGM